MNWGHLGAVLLVIVLPSAATSLVATLTIFRVRGWLDRRTRGERKEALGDGWIWLGDLSGFTLDTDSVGRIVLEHRCGWSTLVRPHEPLGNLVEGEAAAHRGGLGCELRSRGKATK